MSTSETKQKAIRMKIKQCFQWNHVNNNLGIVIHFFVSFKRAPEKVVAHWNAKVVRDMSTSCYYLVKKTDQMVLHRIKTLEIWNYHCGLPVNYVEIRPGKDENDPNSYTLAQKVMGTDFDSK